MKRKNALYPGTVQAEKEKSASALRNKYAPENAPDFIGGKPNYSKFDALHMPPEKVLAYLNID